MTTGDLEKLAVGLLLERLERTEARLSDLEAAVEGLALLEQERQAAAAAGAEVPYKS